MNYVSKGEGSGEQVDRRRPRGPPRRRFRRFRRGPPRKTDEEVIIYFVCGITQSLYVWQGGGEGPEGDNERPPPRRRNFRVRNEEVSIYIADMNSYFHHYYCRVRVVKVKIDLHLVVGTSGLEMKR